ncbi:MAG: hypothetical protein RLY95_192 [Pseudomonadota bacterium]|jgi:sulfate permease, SulP family
MLVTLYAALEALSSAIPSGLGAIVWLGYKIGPEFIPAMVLAMLCALAIVNFVGSFSQRPIIYSARFFEISLLVGFIDSFVSKLNNWGLVDTPSVRLTLVMAVCMGAAILQPIFYSFRLQRLTRYIPAPVFVGFFNAVALILVVNQVQQIVLTLMHKSGESHDSPFILGVICFAAAYLVKRFKPQWPSGICGLLAASIAAIYLEHTGESIPSIVPSMLEWSLPIANIDLSIWKASAFTSMATDVAVVSFLLGVVIFLNTAITSETISQLDDKPEATLAQDRWLAVGKILSAGLGAIPMSGSPAATMEAVSASGKKGISSGTVRLMAVLVIILYGLGWLTWLPQSGMIGFLIFEAYCMYDHASVMQLWNYVSNPNARRSMTSLQREDLFTIVLVAAVGVTVNMVAALLAGVILGLILFARRNGDKPIKEISNGKKWRSNCQRSLSDTLLLDQYGGQILCARLHGALYFGVARSLRDNLEAHLSNLQHGQVQWVVLDWRSVVSFDTTLMRLLDRFELAAAKRGIVVVHSARVDDPKSYVDMDRALEFCEAQLIERHQSHHDGVLGNAVLSSILFADLSQSAQDKLQACFDVRHFKAGEMLIQKGDTTRDLFIITQGRADVMLAGGTVRVASMMTGAIVGEMGFLDGTPRAADVMARDEMICQVLTRERFDVLAKAHPDITQQVLQNLCAELATRLRSIHSLLVQDR